MGESRLIPILTRAATIGRGPPWLVGWVRAQLGSRLSDDPATVRELARRLARVVGPMSANETLVDPLPSHCWAD